MTPSGAGLARTIVSTIGRDRPGLVHQLSSLVTRLGLSIEDSRMTVLGGEFAVLMSVTGAAADVDRLEAALSELASAEDLAFLLRPASEPSNRASRPYQVRIVAMDHPGIVQGVAEFFSARQINIRDLTTETVRAPHTGTALFNLEMDLDVPVDLKISDLRDAFEDYCSAENLDGELAPGHRD